jgi:hypothetical protein
VAAGPAIPPCFGGTRAGIAPRAQENTKHVMGDVSGYYADASVVKFATEDWINSRTLDLAVPRDKPLTWALGHASQSP